MYSELYFLILYGDWKLLFFEENFFKIIVYLFIFIQKPATSLTQEWLVVESCSNPII